MIYIIITIAILGILGISWGCTLSSSHGARFTIFLLVGISSVVTAFWVGHSGGEDSTKMEISIVQRGLGHHFANIEKEYENGNQSAAEEKARYVLKNWNRIEFFEDRKNEKSIYWTDLVTEAYIPTEVEPDGRGQ